jgi:uncharacterized membrane protein
LSRILAFISRFFRQNLLAGILVAVPAAITIYVILFIWQKLDGSLRELLQERPPDSGMPDLSFLNFPGMGVVLLVLLLVVAGLLGRTLLGKRLLRMGEWVVTHIPIARTVYVGAKQLFETILVSGNSTFREVVLIEYPRRGIWVMGFMTGSCAAEINERLEDELVNVFVPTTPNPTSGFLLMLPRKDMYVMKMSVEDAIKLIISGGIVQPGLPSKKQDAMLGGPVMYEKSPFPDGGALPPPESSGRPDACASEKQEEKP